MRYISIIIYNFAPEKRYKIIIILIHYIIYMEIRQIIEQKIKAAGMSKKDVAEKMGIFATNLNGMISAPSWPTLERLANVLNLTPSELIREEEPQQTAEPKTGVICPHCGQLVPLTVCVGHHPTIIPPSGSAGSNEQKSSEDGSAL